MNEGSTAHVPFAQLTVEARVLFLIFSMPVIGYRRLHTADPAEICHQLEQGWNAHKLTVANLADVLPLRNVEEELPHCRPAGKTPSGRKLGEAR